MPQKPQAKVKYTDNQAYFDTNIFTLVVGDVIFLENSAQHYETFINQLSVFSAASSVVTEFEVYPIIPGCSLFITHGSGTFTVIKKTV